MMGRLNRSQGRLFYSFCLEETIPDDHLVGSRPVVGPCRACTPLSRQRSANKPKNAPADNNSTARDDIEPASAGEAERLRVRVEELQAVSAALR